MTARVLFHSIETKIQETTSCNEACLTLYAQQA
jgi:hypothetical protein